ncbi:MAG: putative glycoside hydrolase [Bacillota bacterium]
MKPEHVNKYKLPVLMLVIMILFVSISFAGCLEQSFLSLGKTPTPPEEENKVEENEKTQEEIERELELQRQLEEERKREERRLREEALKVELGTFYVPLPPEDLEDNPPVKAKGIYLTGNTVGLKDRFNNLLNLVSTTELNAMVIDVKNDHGHVTHPSKIEIVLEINASRSAPIKDMEQVMAELKERDIYPIARIVVFKDPYLAEKRPEWAIQSKRGGIWRDNKGVAWINPYQKEVWDYNIAIAKEAALLGFKEIQFDYVRFPENAAKVDREANYPGENGTAKDDAIKNFLIYAREQLEEYNVHIAADTFGVIATSWGDSDRIGQNWEKIAPVVEYNCPMIYPSHYGPGYFGFPVPDANPAGTINRALTDAIKRNAPIENPGIIRPWLQSFTAAWVPGYIPYGAKEVRLQIDTAMELGIDEFLIWNAGNRYIKESFLTEEEAKKREESIKTAREEKGHDVLGATSTKALEVFLAAIRKGDWREAMVYHSTGFTMDHDAYKAWVDSWTGKLSSYKIVSSSQDQEADKKIYTANLTFNVNGENIELNGETFEVFIENHIWRVKPFQDFMDMLTQGRLAEPAQEPEPKTAPGQEEQGREQE